MLRRRVPDCECESTCAGLIGCDCLPYGCVAQSWPLYTIANQRYPESKQETHKWQNRSDEAMLQTEGSEWTMIHRAGLIEGEIGDMVTILKNDRDSWRQVGIEIPPNAASFQIFRHSCKSEILGLSVSKIYTILQSCEVPRNYRSVHQQSSSSTSQKH